MDAEMIDLKIQRITTAIESMKTADGEKTGELNERIAGLALELVGEFLKNQQRIADALHVIAAAADARK